MGFCPTNRLQLCHFQWLSVARKMWSGASEVRPFFPESERILLLDHCGGLLKPGFVYRDAEARCASEGSQAVPDLNPFGA